MRPGRGVAGVGQSSRSYECDQQSRELKEGERRMKRVYRRPGVACWAIALGLCASQAQAQSHWQDADLTALTGGANAAARGIAMTFDPVWKTMRTHYVAVS